MEDICGLLIRYFLICLGIVDNSKLGSGRPTDQSKYGLLLQLIGQIPDGHVNTVLGM